MISFPYLKFFGSIAGAVALATAAWLIVDRFDLAAQVRDHTACAAAAADPKDGKPLDRCADAIRAQVNAARQDRQCTRALGLKDRSAALFGIRASCPAIVNQEVALRHAAEGNLADAQATIATLISGQNAAVARAEARVQSVMNHKGKADAAIAAAPRRADGIAVCDAACLRALAGE